MASMSSISASSFNGSSTNWSSINGSLTNLSSTNGSSTIFLVLLVSVCLLQSDGKTVEQKLNKKYLNISFIEYHFT